VKSLIISTIFLLFANPGILSAQKRPLTGSGVISTLTFTQSGYDKLNLLDFEGKIEISIGQSHHVLIEIDDNIAKLITFDLNKEENELTIAIKGNKNGRLYLENIRSTIKISMPEASVIKHRGNSNVIITGIAGRYFRIDQQGNGDVQLLGKIDELDISKTGNGSVFAEQLLCKTANIHTIGNGNVKINATNSFSAKGVGNGDVVQVGKGTVKPFSGLIGNGQIIKPKL
jgi:hypothetical protein